MLIALVACQPNEPAPTPTVSVPVTTASATVQPTPTETPTPTSSEQALLAEAEAAYRGYWKADLEVSVAGGADKLPASVAKYVMGDYAVATESRYQQKKNNDAQIRNESAAAIRWTRKASNAEGSLVAIESCIDGTKVETRDKNSEWKAGGIVQAIYYLKRDADGSLKIYKAKVVQQGGCT